MFSVITPVYNGAHVVEHAIRSVLSQTCADWELVIVDDGSTDELMKVITPFLQDPRIRLICQANAGVAVARNTAMEAAQHPYLCFLDADDEFLPNHLATFARMIQAYPDAGLYCTAYETYWRAGGKSDNAHCFPGNGAVVEEPDFFAYTERLGGKVYLGVVGVCVPAAVAHAMGGYEPGIRIGEDTDFFLRIAARYKVVLCAEVTACYHHEKSTATADSGLDMDWVFQRREAALLADTQIPAVKREYLRHYMDRFRIHKSRHLLMQGRKKEARAVLRQVTQTGGALWSAYWVTRACALVPAPMLRKFYRVLGKGEGR